MSIRKILEQLESENRKGYLNFLHETYGRGMREGIEKLSIVHPVEIAEIANIEDYDDMDRSFKVLKASLFHDVLEDYDVTEEDLINVGLKEEELELVKRLSRNKENPDGSDYWDGIFQDEDAIMIKLSDRISNLRDLKNWIRSEKGFNTKSKGIYDKYSDECKIIDEKFEEKYMSDDYLDSLRNPITADIWNLKVEQDNLVNEVGSLLEKYGDEIREYNKRPVNEKLFKDIDVENFNIDREDIFRTIGIIKDMYRKYPELRESYPSFLERLDKAIDKVKKIMDTRGMDYLKMLFDKVKFDIDDFIEAYEQWVDEKIMNVLPKLKSLREEIPKDGIKVEIADELGVSEVEVERMIESEDRGDLEKVYNVIKKYMDDVIDDLESELETLAENIGGDLIWRYKDLGRAIDKFLDEENEYNDFLDLGDLLGFRGRFDHVRDMVEFGIEAIEDRDSYAFKINNYVGSDRAYQGVNMSFSYQGNFNYEVQSVVDTMQVASDVNHDIIYKEVMEVSAEESRAVMMLVQICLAITFEDIFNFDVETEIDF